MLQTIIGRGKLTKLMQQRLGWIFFFIFWVTGNLFSAQVKKLLETRSTIRISSKLIKRDMAREKERVGGNKQEKIKNKKETLLVFLIKLL